MNTRVCRATVGTRRIGTTRIGNSEVNGRMTPNWPASVVFVLLAAFFALAFIGIGLGAYAASALKKAEGRSEEKASLES